MKSRLKDKNVAKPKDKPEPPAARPRGKFLRTLGVLVVLTVFAAGTGGLLGLHMVEAVDAAIKAKAAEGESAPEPLYSAGTNLHRLPPVVANLATPEDAWVRVEASIVFDDEAIDNPELIAGEIAEDMLAYLRTVSLGQIQGASGLLHLREDLNDRAAIRSSDRVRELIIETLVVQ